MQSESSDSANRLPSLKRRIARLVRRAGTLEVISNKYWTARRVIFFSGAVLALGFCKYSGGKAGVVLAALFVAAFCVVAIYHRKLRESLARNALLINIKQIQVARILLDWEGMPATHRKEIAAESLPEAAHPFETDLDITGERSLIRLLDTAVTKEGSRRLLSWLLSSTPDPSVIRKRQSLVEELKRHSLFRDKLQLHSAIAGAESRAKRNPQGIWDQWDSSILVDWIEHRVTADSLLPTVTLLVILACANITLIILAGFNFIPHVWPVVWLIYVGVMIAKQGRIAAAWEELQELERALRRFRGVFQYLEGRGYQNTPGLAAVCAPFLDSSTRPSAELRRLERLASALGLRTNALLWLVVQALVPWDFFFTHRLELLKKDLAHLVPEWLNSWHELEALNSLANFAYLNPQYVFPEIVTQATWFEARALGHPLIKPEFRVCNDFELDDRSRIAILTGSNMAGKSTFLRTVGVNLCLAYAGAPVNAAALQVSLFRPFTCIKVSDSVQDGLSYFYAEVKRLKALLAAAEQQDGLPLLFLIDEIFRGTNSRERHIGSRAYIRTLAGKSTVGLVATHDLELVKLADEIPGVMNFHFREELREGKMIFDFQLRPGPCPTTNAIEIMRLEGLPVDDHSENH